MDSYKQQLLKISEAGLQRELQQTVPVGSGYCDFNGQRMLNVSSNDYLGLNTDNQLKARFLKQLDPELASFAGSGSSRLLTGNSPLYARFEEAVADWLGKPNAKVLCYNSGYHANLGILPTICDKNDLILSDKLCHASLLDGIRLSAATHLRFRHNDLLHLEQILEKKRHNYRRVFIVTESLFSMGGDFSDIPALIKLKHQYDALLYLDEAHSIGVYGPYGRGLAAEQNHLNHIDVLVCPMGKAMASQGAMVITNPVLHDLLINTSRTLIFTTALPPINLAWSTFIVENMTCFSDKRESLKETHHAVNQKLTEYGLPTSESYIIPIIVGDNHKAILLSEHLRKNHILVFPIRPPTVALNTARIRVTLTADMLIDDAVKVFDYIGDFMKPNKAV